MSSRDKSTPAGRHHTAGMNRSGFPCIRTADGTVIVRDPRTGLSASGPTVAEALAELRRLLTEREAA